MVLQGGIFGQRSGQSPREEALRELALFTVGDALCGTDLQGVQEILAAPAVAPTSGGGKAGTGVTPLPDAPQFVEGVINLRGLALPLIDLRKRFGLSGEKKSEVGSQESGRSRLLTAKENRQQELARTEDRSQGSREKRRGGRSRRGRVLVCRMAGQIRGIVVDAVEGILRVPADSVEPPPALGRRSASYLQGIARQGDRLVLLLDLEAVLTREEQIRIEDAMKRSRESKVRSPKSPEKATSHAPRAARKDPPGRGVERKTRGEKR